MVRKALETDAGQTEEEKRRWVTDQLMAVLRAGGDPNTECGDGRPLLLVAMDASLKWNEPKVVFDLLTAHADPDVNVGGATPLQIAARHEDCPVAGELITGLLRAGAKVLPNGAKGQTVVHEAASRGREHALRALSGYVDITDSAGATPLFYARTARTVGLLLEARADPLALNQHGQSAVHSAASRGRVAVLSALLRYAEDPGSLATLPDENGYDPLDMAAYFGHLDACKVLHANGGSLYSKTGLEGRMPWVLAIQQGNSGCGLYLLCLLLWAHVVYVILWTTGMAFTFWLGWKASGNSLVGCGALVLEVIAGLLILSMKES
jgi:ankyrin repeat protein